MSHRKTRRSGIAVRDFGPLAVALLLLAATRIEADDKPGAASFAGFPPIGKTNPGKRSTSVIASDPVEGLLRPKWTRAMADLGSGVGMYRYQGDIYFTHGVGDGHKGVAQGVKPRTVRYVSKDEGKSWKKAPVPNGILLSRYMVVVDKRLLNYTFEEGCTVVQTSDDNVQWTPKQKVYKPPHWLYEVSYDPASKLFWCAAQSMAVGKKPDGKWILRDVHLVKSKDGIHWEHVATLPLADVDISEAIVRFEPDGTIVIIIRRKWRGDYCTIATARLPFQKWDVSSLPEVAEGHRFFAAGGQVFMGSRAYFRDEIPEIKAHKTLRYVSADGVAYTVIHRFTPDRRLVAWAVVDSMGDCSYPFFVETPTEVLVAYYSEHEDNVCKPYLAAFDKKQFLAPLPGARPDFSRFPAIGKVHPGQRTTKVITSDALTTGLRPKWTRAMADASVSANLYRFRGELHFTHDAGIATETILHISKDEGRTWPQSARVADADRSTPIPILSLGDKLFRYRFDGGQTWAQVSDNGMKWTKPEAAYKAPFRLDGIIYDSASKTYWCAAHAVPNERGTGLKPVLPDPQVQLINSKDGIRWNQVSTVFQVPKLGEAALAFEADRTAVVIMRSNTNASHFLAWAKPPYKAWKLSEMPGIAEEHSLTTIGGRTFLATRGNYTEKHPLVSQNPKEPDGRRSFIAIHRVMKTRELQLWAVLDSMGQCSRPRLVETPTEVLCCYVSQHQDGVLKPYLAAFDKKEFLRKR